MFLPRFTVKKCSLERVVSLRVLLALLLNDSLKKIIKCCYTGAAVAETTSSLTV